jgi:hypothetical protein
MMKKVLQYSKKLSHFILCRHIILHYLFNVLLSNRFCITVFTVCHSSMNENNATNNYVCVSKQYLGKKTACTRTILYAYNYITAVVYDIRHKILWSAFLFFGNYFIFSQIIFGGGGGIGDIWAQKPVTIFNIQGNGNWVFPLRIFT